MSHLFKVKVQFTPVPVEPTVKEINVIAENPEEATAKVVVGEGETVVEATDQGEVVA